MLHRLNHNIKFVGSNIDICKEVVSTGTVSDSGVEGTVVEMILFPVALQLTRNGNIIKNFFI